MIAIPTISDVRTVYIPIGMRMFGLAPKLFSPSKIIVLDVGPVFCSVTVWSRGEFVHQLNYRVEHIQETIIDAYALVEE